jgi:hypothetical protein
VCPPAYVESPRLWFFQGKRNGQAEGSIGTPNLPVGDTPMCR